MSGLTRYGDFWGRIPETAGNVYWVAPAASYTVAGKAYSASDGNDGLDPRRALVTIDRAWNLVTADVGDVIVLLPGTHSPSASIAADVAGVTMTGLPAGKGNVLKQKTTIGAVTGDQTINVTAANIEIAYLNFIPVTADTAIDFSAAGDSLHIHHCSFDMATPAASTGTKGIEALGAASNALIDNCYFECDGAQGEAIALLSAVDSVVEDCIFAQSAGTWAVALSILDAAAARLIIRRNQFSCAGTAMTAGINGTTLTGASTVTIADNVAGVLVTKLVDGFAAADVDLYRNFIATVAGGDGGATLVVATT